MTPELLPAILAHDEQTFRARLSLVEGLVTCVHIDVMDGAFVPNETWFDADVFASIETPVVFEFHLMVRDPRTYIEKLVACEKAARFIWHVDAPGDHTTLIKHCHTRKTEVGLALSPTIPIDALEAHAKNIEEILIMGAMPGFSGKQLEPAMIDRVRITHARWPDLPIGFDIGVNSETISSLKSAGVSRFCAASAIFETKNPKKQIQGLQNLIGN